MSDSKSWFTGERIPLSEPDPWERSMYVSRYREELENVARDLYVARGSAGPLIYVRFNKQLLAAELMMDRYGVMARIEITGEGGCPESVKVFYKDGVLPEEPFKGKFFPKEHGKRISNREMSLSFYPYVVKKPA